MISKKQIKRQYNKLETIVLNSNRLDLRNLIEFKDLKKAKISLLNYFDGLLKNKKTMKFRIEQSIFSHDIVSETYGRPSFKRYKRMILDEERQRIENERFAYESVLNFLPYVNEELKTSMIERLTNELKNDKD